MSLRTIESLSWVARAFAWAARRRLIVTAIPTAAMVSATVLVFLYARGVELERIDRSLQIQADHAGHVLAQTFDLYVETVQGIASFYDASETVERHEFDAFVRRNIIQYPGIQALEWVPRVAHDARAEYEMAARADGNAGFQFARWTADRGWVRSAEQWADEYFPVYFVYPRAGNEPAQGIDLASNPTRLAGLQRARDTGLPVATERIALAQGTGARAGFLIAVPVFERERPLATVAERRRHLRGFALGVFRVADIVAASLVNLRHDEMVLTIIDVFAGGEQRLLFEEPSADAAGSPGGFEHRVSIDYLVGGRLWRFHFIATPAFVAAHRRSDSWLIGAGGVFTTVLLTVVLLLLTGRNRAVERLVEVRTRELASAEARYRDLYDNAPDMYATVDAQTRRITDCNDALVRNTGFSRDAIVGSPVEQMYELEFRGQARNSFTDFVRTGRLAQQERRLATANGRALDVNVAATAIRGAGGEVVASRTVWSDISRVKATERKLRKALGRIEELSERMQRQANTDELTELDNRRSAGQRLVEEIARADRHRRSLSVAVCDIDHFKSVNDRFGHEAGDRALVAVAAVMKRQLREVDALARWGGEEFLAIMPETDGVGAARAAERLRRAVQEAAVAEVGNVTVSIGVAEHTAGEEPGTLVARADNALYLAKDGGRNRVVAAEAVRADTSDT